MSVDLAFISAAAHHLSLGLSRAPLPPSGLGPAAPDQPLKLLALAGQAQRFLRPAVPGAFDPVRIGSDPRRIVPDRARTLFLEVDLGNGTTGLAVADLMNRRGMRPHPFDMPRLAAFVKAHAELLGPSAEAFAAGTEEKGVETADYFSADMLDETNWTQASPGRKGDFVRGLRLSDPAKARALMQAGFSGQNAAARQKVLESFAVNLSGEDLPFLSSLAGDRAPTVRALATRLASRIPGSPAYAERLKDVMSRLKVAQSGLLRRRLQLVIEYPATIRDGQQQSWTVEAFAGLPLDGVAAALGLPVAAMVEASKNAGALPIAFARQAAAEQRFDLLESLVSSGGDQLWSSVLSGDEADLAALADPTIGARFAEAVIHPETWERLPPGRVFEQLYALIRHPLPSRALQRLAASQVWRQKVPEQAAEQAGATYAALVPLTPPLDRPVLRQAVARLPIAAGHKAKLLLDLFDAIDPP